MNDKSKSDGGGGESSTGEMVEFSFRTRAKTLERFKNEVFDLLVIGGGITGGAVARDAVSRGLKVALIDKHDFAFGTSSRSSKLIHGGLRYLQNFELGLVFEALSERTLLLKTAPHMVQPLQFYLPVYKGDSHGRGLLSIGLWLYDMLALFRSPGFHKGLSKKTILKAIPFLKSEGLKGGFSYFDAWMRDDALAIETLRSAHAGGAAVANYVEALRPIWESSKGGPDPLVKGFYVKDLEPESSAEFPLRAHRTVVCAGPWTDELGRRISPDWKRWLTPSKGIHLVFDLKRIPIPGAMVMSNDSDGRVSFVVPRPDYGAGVVIVGTTDGATGDDPEKAQVEPADVEYLMVLLNKYFPALKLTREDIISTYVGVRPLMGNEKTSKGTAEQNASVLQKVSREHHIDQGPGGTVLVAGGKYTTHRAMATEVVDYALKAWESPASKANTRAPINAHTTHEALAAAREEVKRRGLDLPARLLERYGLEILDCLDDPGQKKKDAVAPPADPEGFPHLRAQLRHAIRYEMAVHLEDFYLRRIPLFQSRRDHGWPWAEHLIRVWAEEFGRDKRWEQMELARMKQEFATRSV